jgi:hypothetical protein
VTIFHIIGWMKVEKHRLSKCGGQMSVGQMIFDQKIWKHIGGLYGFLF